MGQSLFNLATHNSINPFNNEICYFLPRRLGRLPGRCSSHIRLIRTTWWKCSGFGTGNASPYGASSTGLGVANSYNGGFASGSGNGYGGGSPFFGGYNAGGNGQGFAYGK